MGAGHSEPHRLPYKDKDPWLVKIGKNHGNHRRTTLEVSSLQGLLRAVQGDLGIVELPRDLIVIKEKGLIQVLPHLTGPEIELSLAYPQELKERTTIRSLKEYLTTGVMI